MRTVPAGCLQARQQAALKDCLIPFQPEPGSVPAFMSQAPDSVGTTRRMKTGPGRWWAVREQSIGKKTLTSTLCWSCLPCFLRTGSRPRDYVTSGGHGRWRAGSDTSNPALTLTFPDMVPQPPLLWGVEQRGMGSGPNSCHPAQ